MMEAIVLHLYRLILRKFCLPEHSVIRGRVADMGPDLIGMSPLITFHPNQYVRLVQVITYRNFGIKFLPE